MKKTILTSLFALTVASAAVAQGTLNWSSIIPTYMTAQTNSTVYSALAGGGSVGTGSVGAIGTAANGFYFALLYTSSGASQPTSVSALTAWSDTGLVANNSTSTAGRLTPSAGTASGGAAVPGWAIGDTKSVILVGWSANLGTSWAAVSTILSNWSTQAIANAYFGMSTVGTITSSASNPGSTIFGSTAGLINSPNTQLYLLPVPEPGTMALAALGGASLLLFRRRK